MYVIAGTMKDISPQLPNKDSTDISEQWNLGELNSEVLPRPAFPVLTGLVERLSTLVT